MKYLLFLAIKSQGKKARGFTLIELLVVVVILGVLAAVGLPNLLQQVSKGRQAEALAILGQINRAQQAYRYENGTFARLDQLPISGINNARFYGFEDIEITSDPGGGLSPDAFGANYRAEARPLFDNEIKNYAGGVRQRSNGSLVVTICEAITPLSDEEGSNVTLGPTGGCINGRRFGDPPIPTPVPPP
ncbi:type IV pilin-like G/H family protein [Microcystis aeruginosa]|uniref:type IV pilin-like G/H family protein n=1 Tax=Microcystis aeruginosa TaxID=1126 RepID=UPI00232AA597|nr:type IV pilin-like G/H family protein [Microcystis aeruginosa]MDB9412700.1 type IV pilin-like G/H family protein [Microcystis aeruginosa CS-567/02]